MADAANTQQGRGRSRSRGRMHGRSDGAVQSGSAQLRLVRTLPQEPNDVSCTRLDAIYAYGDAQAPDGNDPPPSRITWFKDHRIPRWQVHVNCCGPRQQKRLRWFVQKHPDVPLSDLEQRLQQLLQERFSASLCNDWLLYTRSNKSGNRTVYYWYMRRPNVNEHRDGQKVDAFLRGNDRGTPLPQPSDAADASAQQPQQSDAADASAQQPQQSDAAAASAQQPQQQSAIADASAQPQQQHGAHVPPAAEVSEQHWRLPPKKRKRPADIPLPPSKPSSPPSEPSSPPSQPSSPEHNTGSAHAARDDARNDAHAAAHDDAHAARDDAHAAHAGGELEPRFLHQITEQIQAHLNAHEQQWLRLAKGYKAWCELLLPAYLKRMAKKGTNLKTIVDTHCKLLEGHGTQVSKTLQGHVRAAYHRDAPMCSHVLATGVASMAAANGARGALAHVDFLVCRLLDSMIKRQELRA